MRLLAGGALLLSRAAPAKTKLKVAIFSKHLQFLQGEELAKATAADSASTASIWRCARAGTWSRRRVAKDLPALVAILRKHGLEVPMITTDIADAETPFAEDMLKAASALGIRYYRFGAFKWEAGKPYRRATGGDEAAAGETGGAQRAVPDVRDVSHALRRGRGGRVDLGSLVPDEGSRPEAGGR